MPEPKAEYFIDDKLDSYEHFYDRDWAKKFNDESDKSNLQKACFDLMAEWKGISVVHRMPWLLVTSFAGFYEGVIKKEDPPFYEQLSKRFLDYVFKKSNLGAMRKQELTEAVNQMREEVVAEMDKAKLPTEPELVWRKYVVVNEFVMTLWHAQRQAYASLFFAYENFLQRVVAVARKDDDYKAKNGAQLKKDLESVLGQTLASDCLDDVEIEIAKMTRHDLAHNGGRISPKLLTKPYKFEVHNGQIHLKPNDVRALFDLLKVKAMKVAEAAATIPALK